MVVHVLCFFLQVLLIRQRMVVLSGDVEWQIVPAVSTYLSGTSKLMPLKQVISYNWPEGKGALHSDAI